MLTYGSGLTCKQEIAVIKLLLSSAFIRRDCLLVICDFVPLCKPCCLFRHIIPKSYLNVAYYLMKSYHNVTAEENKSTFAIMLYNLYILKV